MTSLPGLAQKTHRDPEGRFLNEVSLKRLQVACLSDGSCITGHVTRQTVVLNPEPSPREPQVANRPKSETPKPATTQLQEQMLSRIATWWNRNTLPRSRDVSRRSPTLPELCSALPAGSKFSPALRHPWWPAPSKGQRDKETMSSQSSVCVCVFRSSTPSLKRKRLALT